MGYFSKIQPFNISKAHKKKLWIFMLYREFGSEREDKQEYCAFLFRDNERTSYGIKEFFGDSIPHMKEFRKLATKDVLANSYRRILLSDDPEFPQIWKRH
jgi:hypothetical protein